MKTKIILSVSLILIIIFGISSYNQPYKRVERFVEQNSELLEDKITNNEPIPSDLTGNCYNTWNYEHEMSEFILFTKGNIYYGCYYSKDDVPLPFQNAQGIGLNKIDDNRWGWHSIGDNRGITRKIKDGWYYFEASF